MVRTRRTLAAAAAAAALASCNSSDNVAAVDHSALHGTSVLAAKGGNGNGSSLEKAVHAATARFHSLKQAEKAGYVPFGPCVAIAIGGMGHHYLNMNLVDGTFDPLNPEALVYAPDKHGNLKLAAVEYVVLNTGQGAPTFAGQAFDEGGAPIELEHWTLHAWLHQPNPTGTFMPWNPDVTCPSPLT